MKRNVVYPEIAKQKRIEGTVTVKFTVTDQGDVICAKVVKSLSPECDIEALRVTKGMPNWLPGKQNGKPVYVELALPIKFEL